MMGQLLTIARRTQSAPSRARDSSAAGFSEIVSSSTFGPTNEELAYVPVRCGEGKLRSMPCSQKWHPTTFSLDSAEESSQGGALAPAPLKISHRFSVYSALELAGRVDATRGDSPTKGSE